MIWELVKKESRFFLVYGLGMNALLGFYLLIRRGETLNPVLAIALGLLQIVIMLVPVMVNEQYEEKNNGDAFLSMLPLKKSEQVGVKAGVVLASAVVFAVLNVLWAVAFSPSPDMFMAVRGFYIACGLAGVLAAALFYVGIFWIGYTRFVVIVLAFWTGVGVLVSGLVRYFKKGGGFDYQGIIDFLSSASFAKWGIIALIVLVIYAGLMALALIFKYKEK